MAENENQQNIQNTEQNNIENNEQNNQQNQEQNNNTQQNQENNNNNEQQQQQHQQENNNNNNNQEQPQEQNNNQGNQQQNNQENVQAQNEQNNNQENPQNNQQNNNQENAQAQNAEQLRRNNIIDLRRQEEEKIVEIIKIKIGYIREKYNFSIQFSDAIQNIIKCFQDHTYTKLTHSINESLNFITFFKDSAELYSKFAKQIQETNNLIMSSQKHEKLNDNILSEVMQKTQNTLFENITKISNTMRQNIINKGPLANLQEKIAKIEYIKKENYEKLKNILDSKKKLQKNMSKYDKLFETYLPRPDINLYIIDTKDSLYKINGLYVEINNLVKDAVLIYIKECKSIFNMDLTKNFEEIEKYYKTLDEKSEDKMFKLNKIFTTRENEAEINNLLQFYYTMLCESNTVKKELLKDKNKFSVQSESNLFLFFEWFVSVSPQPVDISVQELLIKQIAVKRDPGIFMSWKDSVFIFTKQQHLLLFDKPGYLDDLVRIFELDKTSFRKRTDKKNKFLFELIANRKGKIMDFKGTYLFDALNQENVDEIPNLVYSAYNA